MAARFGAAIALFALMTANGVSNVPAYAGEEHLVRMLTDTTDGRFRFDPELLRVDAGDTVRFSADSHLHASHSIPSMVPEEDDNWSSRNGEDIVVEFDEPGVYGYKCSAHYSLGMVGLVLVDEDPKDLRQARQSRHPPAAAATFDRLLDQAEADE